MTRRAEAAPRSAREVWALVLVLLMIWFGVALTIHGLGGLSDHRAAALGLAGALLILCAGFAWARRFRRR
jgi:hypothetical protein